MTRIGFEFEFLSLLYDDEILDDLGKKYNITVDPSIRHDEKCMKRDGWMRWEVITPPEPKKKALKTLREVQHYLIDTGARTNTSCGFHVNVSAKDMSKFDPMTLICTTNEDMIGNTFHRADNPYCVPWSNHFTALQKKIKRKEKFDKNKILIDNATRLVDSSAFGEWISEEHHYAKLVQKDLADKYVSINVSKMEHDYVEFRMMGGTDYHYKMLEPFVLNLADEVNDAAKGKNKQAIRDYFEQYEV
jgi:hypothetical protein